MPEDASTLYLDHFIKSVLHGELAGKFKYEYFPWLLWPKNIDKPQIMTIHEPKLPYYSIAELDQSLTALHLSMFASDLQVLENIQLNEVSTKHVVVYQSKTASNRLLRASFDKEPVKNLFQAHQLICLIMGARANTYYQNHFR